MDRIKVLVADSSQIYALGLCHLLSEDERIEVFNHVHSCQHIIDEVEQIKPDIILVDSELQNHEEEDRVLDKLQELHLEAKAIVLIPPENNNSILDNALNMGFKGILPKTLSPTELLKSVIDMAKEGATIYPTLLPQIIEKLAAKLQERSAMENPLSIREVEVVALVAEGKSDREIAETLLISENTVKSHIKRIYSKLNIDNRVKMARYVLLDNPTLNPFALMGKNPSLSFERKLNSIHHL